MASDTSASTEGPVLLFVYGSLLRGQANHFWLREARYLGDAQTEPFFELLDLGPFPALVDGGTATVHGELYEIGAELLPRLDVFEDVPELYRRARISLRGGVQAQAYLLQPRHLHGQPRVPSGDWRKR
jgi:gamma-glutamylcyclotransferase (GGCT)/AIG2-like uncharacterized protein YtfP